MYIASRVPSLPAGRHTGRRNNNKKLNDKSNPFLEGSIKIIYEEWGIDQSIGFINNHEHSHHLHLWLCWI